MSTVWAISGPSLWAVPRWEGRGCLPGSVDGKPSRCNECLVWNGATAEGLEHCLQRGRRFLATFSKDEELAGLFILVEIYYATITLEIVPLGVEGKKFSVVCWICVPWSCICIYRMLFKAHNSWLYYWKKTKEKGQAIWYARRLALMFLPHSFIQQGFRNLDYARHSAWRWRCCGYCGEDPKCLRAIGLVTVRWVLLWTQALLSEFRRQNGPSNTIQGTKPFHVPTSLISFLNKLILLRLNLQPPNYWWGKIYKLPHCQGRLGTSEYLPRCLHFLGDLCARVNSRREQKRFFSDALRRGVLASTFETFELFCSLL